MELTLEDISKKLSLDEIDKCFKVKTYSQDSVKSVKVTRAAPAGEGLISAVYRIHVEGFIHKTTFVAKGLVKDVLLRRSLRCNDFFAREVLFFSEILPEFKRVQKSLGAKEDIQRHIPICYACHSGNGEDYLVLEDLTESSCKTIETPTKADRDLILQILAHIHAVSTAFRVSEPVVFENIANKMKYDTYFNKGNKEWFSKYMRNAIEIDVQVLLEYEPESSVYYKKFLKLVNSDPYGQLIELCTYTGDHPTMSHGDAWFPNFMYSKDRAVAIDFQLFRCVSPVSDLTYYLALCSNLCPRKEDYYEAINTYYSFLDRYLADMGLSVRNLLSKDDLDKELKKYGRLGFIAALTSIPLLATSERCDVGVSFQEKYGDVERIPLDELWPLAPMTNLQHKMNLVNAVRVAVDVGLI